MDIPRHPVHSAKRKLVVALFVGVALVGLTYLSQLPRALRGIERSDILIGTVQRGPLTVNVKANGTLAPVNLRVITAQTDCVVAQIYVYPGAPVHRGTVIAELQSPELEQAKHDAMWELRRAEAEYQLQYLDQKAAVENAIGAAKGTGARMEAYLRLKDKGLYRDNSIDLLNIRIAQEQAEVQLAASKARLRFFESGGTAEVAPAKARLEQARSLYELKQAQLNALKVRAGMSGILQQLPIQVGERCTAGGVLAIVAAPVPLKAVLKVNQIQAKDVGVGLPVVVDAYSGKVRGEVIRTDPSIRNGTMTVDVRIDEPLPAGARPDLAVEGTIQIEHIPDSLFLTRPSLVQAHANASLFKLSPDGREATRVPVRFGRGSDTHLEVIDGLLPGQQVIVSDTSALADMDRIRIR